MQRQIVQPIMPREIDLTTPQWIVVTPNNWEDQLAQIGEMRLQADMDRDVSSSIKYDITRGEQESAWEKLHDGDSEDQKRVKEVQYKERIRQKAALVQAQQEQQQQAKLAAEEKKKAAGTAQEQKRTKDKEKLLVAHAERLAQRVAETEADSPYIEFKSTLKF